MPTRRRCGRRFHADKYRRVTTRQPSSARGEGSENVQFYEVEDKEAMQMVTGGNVEVGKAEAGSVSAVSGIAARTAKVRMLNTFDRTSRFTWRPETSKDLA
jgi:hypothetical protein